MNAKLAADLADITASLGADLAAHANEKAKLLTDAELWELNNGAGFARAARILLVQLAPDRINTQWNAEGYRRNLRQLRRWLRNRY